MGTSQQFWRTGFFARRAPEPGALALRIRYFRLDESATIHKAEHWRTEAAVLKSNRYDGSAGNYAAANRLGMRVPFAIAEVV